ncbi:hypothetical protein [Tranquillimonas alkanivorans]|nr:hypothetical protein [Tranquillimonas alkanivorans]
MNNLDHPDPETSWVRLRCNCGAFYRVREVRARQPMCGEKRCYLCDSVLKAWDGKIGYTFSLLWNEAFDLDGALPDQNVAKASAP